MGADTAVSNNFIASPNLSEDHFRNYIARVDHNLNNAWRVYARWNHNYRDGGIKNPYSWDTAANQATHNYRGNDGALLDFVGTLDPRTVLTVRAGFNRYYTGSVFAPHDISSLGFPQPLLSQLQLVISLKSIPRLRRDAQCSFKLEGCIWRDRRLALHDDPLTLINLIEPLFGGVPKCFQLRVSFLLLFFQKA